MSEITKISRAATAINAPAPAARAESIIAAILKSEYFFAPDDVANLVRAISAYDSTSIAETLNHQRARVCYVLYPASTCKDYFLNQIAAAFQSTNDKHYKEVEQFVHKWDASYKSVFPSHWLHAKLNENTRADMLNKQQSPGGGQTGHGKVLSLRSPQGLFLSATPSGLTTSPSKQQNETFSVEPMGGAMFGPMKVGLRTSFEQFVAAAPDGRIYAAPLDKPIPDIMFTLEPGPTSATLVGPHGGYLSVDQNGQVAISPSRYAFEIAM